MDINKLIKEAHETAVEKGWWDQENFFDSQIANMHAEVSEAWEDYRNNKGLNEIYYECAIKNSEILSCTCRDDRGLCNCFECKEGKPCGIPIEFADVCIRIFDTLGKYKIDVDGIELGFNVNRSANDFPKFIAKCHVYLSNSLEKADSSEEATYYSFLWLTGLVFKIKDFCLNNNIDLEKAIELKMKYNKTRPWRHNGKRA